MKVYTIDGDDLDMLLSELAEGGYTSTQAYRLQLRVYGHGADKISVQVNDGGWTMPMGELAYEVPA
jgi:hypothetical protein